VFKREFGSEYSSESWSSSYEDRDEFLRNLFGDNLFDRENYYMLNYLRRQYNNESDRMVMRSRVFVYIVRFIINNRKLFKYISFTIKATGFAVVGFMGYKLITVTGQSLIRLVKGLIRAAKKKPSKPVKKPSKSVNKPSKPVKKPRKIVKKPSKPVKKPSK
jgi:hypothetical protein